MSGGGNVSGQCRAPASKSHTQRVYAAALLSEGESEVLGVGHSDDERTAKQLIQDLGAQVSTLPDGREKILGTGQIRPLKRRLHCGESGLSLRLFTTLLAGSGLGSFEMCAEGTLLHRPQSAFVPIFKDLGVSFSYQTGHLPPLVVESSGFVPKSISVDASLGSQYVTGLLMLYAHLQAKGKTLRVKHMKSKPYVALTQHVLSAFGAQIEEIEENVFLFLGEKLQACRTEIEGDWSSAACLMVAAGLSGELEILGLNKHSVQADRRITTLLAKAGVNIEWSNQNHLLVRRGEENRPIETSIEECPDLFPYLAAWSSFAKGRSCLSGIHRLQHKESDRLFAVTDMLERVGISCWTEEDSLFVEGQHDIEGNVQLPTYGDHRIVMLGALLSLRARQQITLEDTNAVNKSFPDFFSCLSSCGVSLREGT